MPGCIVEMDVKVIKSDKNSIILKMLGNYALGCLDSLSGIIHVLRFGGTLPWEYKGTPYKKELNPDSITTAFVRCIDLTDSGIIVKVTRIKI